MARRQNTVEKRLREMAKKRKAEEKRVQRRDKKGQAEAQSPLKSENGSGDKPHSVIHGAS